MTRRCILQIGTEKTGTTSLQAFLAANRERLAARGIRYPRFPGATNHTGLAAYAMDEARRDPLRSALGIGDAAAVSSFRTRFAKEAQAELGASGITVFCSEHCHSRLTSREEVQRLFDLLDPHFDRIDVSVYLRRQDRVAISLYSTRLKSGATDTDILPRTDADDPYFNYDRSLALWEEVFAPHHVHVRLFEREMLLGGDVVADFLSAWGLGAMRDYKPAAKLNESITAEAQDFLRRVNATLEAPSGLPIEAVQGPLADSLARAFPGKGPRPSRAAAQAFLDCYRASNEAVRRRHFPSRATLFDESFDAYPAEADTVAFGIDEMARVAARLQTAHAREVRRLEAEIRLRDGQLAWERGARDDAIALFRRAVALLPDHAEARRTLAEYLYRLERYDEAATETRRAIEDRPGRHEYWHFLGVVLRAAGDLDGAVDAQERALEIEPTHEPSRRTLDALRASLPLPQAAS